MTKVKSSLRRTMKATAILTLVPLLALTLAERSGMAANDPCFAVFEIYERAENDTSRLLQVFAKVWQMDRVSAVGAHKLLGLTPEAEVVRAVEQLIALREVEDASTIFRVAGQFTDVGAQRGVTEAATFLEVERIQPGESILLLMKANFSSTASKQATFRSLNELRTSQVGDLNILLKKAGDEAVGANYGHIYEIQGSAFINRNPGLFGRLERVAVDSVNSNLNRIDSVSEAFAFQFKSKSSPGSVLTLGDITGGELGLQQLVTQAGGKTPALISSNPIDPNLANLAQSMGISIFEVALTR